MEAQSVRRALLVTDGWVGRPTGRHQSTLARAKLAVAYLGHAHNRDDLAGVANFTANLTMGASS